MSKFKVLIISGITVGVLAGGTVALFTSGKKQPSTPASTPTAADKAAELNEKGKLLMFDGKYGEAEPLFVEAVRLVPEPKYLFNLGTTLFQQGRFDEVNKPTDDLLAKTEKLISKVYAECKAQRIACTGMK
jgi:Flp pilus assembly protein TadD